MSLTPPESNTPQSRGVSFFSLDLFYNLRYPDYRFKVQLQEFTPHMITQHEVIDLIVNLTGAQLDTLRAAFFVRAFPGQLLPTQRRAVNQGVMWVTKGYMNSLKALERRDVFQAVYDADGEPFYVLTPLGWRIAYELGLLEKGQWVVTDDGYMMQLINAPFDGARGITLRNRSSATHNLIDFQQSPVMIDGEIFWQALTITGKPEQFRLSAADLRHCIAVAIPNTARDVVMGQRALPIDFSLVVKAEYTVDRVMNRRHYRLYTDEKSYITVDERDADYAAVNAEIVNPTHWWIYVKGADYLVYRKGARDHNLTLLKSLEAMQGAIETSSHLYFFSAFTDQCIQMISINDADAHVARVVLGEWYQTKINALVKTYSNPAHCMEGYNVTPLIKAYQLASRAVKITMRPGYGDNQLNVILGYNGAGEEEFVLTPSTLQIRRVSVAFSALLKYAEWLHEYDETGRNHYYTRPARWEYFLPLIGGQYA